MARKGVEIPVYLNIDDAVTTAESLGKKIEGALEKHKGTEDPQIAKTLKGLEAIQRQLEATEDFRKKLTSGSDQYQDLLKLSDQWATVEQSTRKAYDEYKKYLESIGRSKLVESFTAGPQSIDKRYFGKNRTPEITEQIEKLKELYAAWSRASSEKEKYMGMAYNAAPNDLTQDEANVIATSFQKANDEGDILLLKLNQLEKQNESLNNSGKQSGFKQNFYIVRTLVNDISRGIRNLDSKLKSFTSRLTGIVKNMLHLGKESRKTTNTLNDGFKHALRNIMRYGLGIRSLFFLFRRLRKYALEALGEMAKQLPVVNAQMSRAVQAMNQMKGSLGTLVQPLLNVLVPALEKVAALISKIANLIGGVFAILTGQGKIYKATAGAVDYAASLDKTGAAAKKAKKELEGYLSPIDEINKYQSKRDDDEDNSGGGGGAGAPAFTFEEIEPSDLAKKVADFIQRLIEPIKKAWENMGNFVRTSWRYAMNEVLKLGQSVARDFWRVWEEYDTQRIFQNIFEAIGWIGQAVGNLAKRFREAWDYNDTGYRILKAIRDIVLIISEHIRRAAKATAEWADSLDFKPLLTAFADWLESLKTPADAVLGILEDLYTQVILPLGKWAVEVGGPKLLKVFTDFNKEVKWDELRTKLSELWDALRPFAQKIGEGVIMFIDELSDAAAKFINSQKFKDFIDLCIKWMNDVKPEDVARTIKLVAGAIITLKGALFLLEGIKTLNTTVTAIKTFLALFSAGGVGAGATAATIGEVAGATEQLAAGVGVLWSKLNLFQTALFDAGGTIAFFDQIRFINKQGDIYKLSEDLQNGKISLDEYQEAVDKINNVPIAEAGYSWKQFWKDFFNPADGKNMGQALTSLFGMLNDNTHTYKGEVKALTAEYAQGTLTTSEYNKKLDELKEKYTVNGKLVEDTSLKTVKSLNDIKAGAANMATSVANDNASVNKSYNDVKVKTSYVASEVYNSGAKMEGVSYSLQKTVDKNNTGIKKSVNDMSNTVVKDTDTAKTKFGKSMDDMSKSATENTQTIKDKTDEIKSAFDKSQWTFSGVAEGLGETFRSAIDKVRDYWNPLADSLSGQHTIFGKTFSIDLPKIPYLAQGAVIPPNKEFMAVLGDQKSGTNIETPLSTMVEAFNQALRSSDVGGVKTINFLLPDRRKIAQYTIEGGRIIQTSTGRNPFELA